MRWLGRRDIIQERAAKIQPHDPNYAERLRADTLKLRDNLAWNDVVLPFIDKEIDLLAREVLENDKIAEDDREVMRKLRQKIKTFRRKVKQEAMG